MKKYIFTLVVLLSTKLFAQTLSDFKHLNEIGTSFITNSGNDVYVSTNVQNGKILKFNLADPNAPATEFLTGLDYPTGVAIRGNYLYFAEYATSADGKISRIALNHVNPQVEVLTTGVLQPHGIEFAGSHLYIAEYNANKVSRMNIYSNQLEDFVTGLSAPSDLEFSPSDNHMFVCDRVGNQISKYHITSHQMASGFPVTVNSTPDRITLVGNYLYVSRTLDSKIHIIDLSQATLVPSLLFNGTPSVPTEILGNDYDIFILTNSGLIKRIERTSTRPVYVTETFSSCTDYFWRDSLYTESTSDIRIVHNSNTDEDTILNLQLTINPINNISISYFSSGINNILSALPYSTDYSYQWLRCDNNYSIINSGQDYSLQVVHNGDYAVQVSYMNCVDTIGCYTVTGRPILGDINGNGIIDNGEIAGDANGNGVIDGNERAGVVDPIIYMSNLIGDINGNGIIDGNEIPGDANGNGVIDNGEIAGDINGNGIIDSNEFTGDLNGNGLIDNGEIAGDSDGNGIIDNNEIAGDVSGNGVIDGNEIAGDTNGDGVIGNGEFAGDTNGSGSLDTGEVVGDVNGDGSISTGELAGDANNDGVVDQNDEICNVDTTTSINNNMITANNTSATYQWINCADNSSIAGETSASFTPTQNGNYAVILTEGNCSDTSACITISTIGINELKNVNISIFPNPTNGEVNIVSDAKIQNIEVFNLAGKKVLSAKSDPVNIESLESGMYLFKVETETGITSHRIIKQ